MTAKSFAPRELLAIEGERERRSVAGNPAFILLRRIGFVDRLFQNRKSGSSQS